MRTRIYRYGFPKWKSSDCHQHLIIINATPLGTFPAVDQCPNIPYEFISSDHVLFDLVYNPELSLFLKNGQDKGANTKNGLEMLHGQAIASWDIWNKQNNYSKILIY